MFSVGILYSAKDFLELVSETGLTPNSFKSSFKSFKYADPEKILQIIFKCSWSTLTDQGLITLSKRGQEIATKNYQTALLLQLEDLISNYNPDWASLLPKGRSFAKNYLPSDAKQCFKESGLFEELNEDIIKYWDKLALAYRNYSNEKALEIGRRGESLSYQHEFIRTGTHPKRHSVESNLDGFDILSIVDKNSIQNLSIEVKATSSNIKYARFHVTRNEWETANSSLNCIFHLWHMAHNPILKIVHVSQISYHIPLNNGEGSWELVEIPFKLFF